MSYLARLGRIHEFRGPLMKRVIIALVLLLLVGAIVVSVVGWNVMRDMFTQQFFASMKPAPVTVSTYKVEPTSWTPGIEAIGTVGASSGVDLTVEITGVVKSINFSANQRVTAGSVLVQLDDAVQKADLETAQTQLALNKLALDRAQQLRRSGAGTQSALDTAQAAAQTSQTEVSKLQAVLDQKQLRAPFGGVLGIPKIDLGQFIQPGAVVATLQNLDTMRADFSIPEQQLGQLGIGQQVTFGLDGDAEGFSGKIAGIEPKVDASSRLVSVRAVISNPNGKLSPGQFVQVRVELPKEDNVIAIPDTALVSSLYGDYVYIVRPAPPPEPAPAAEGAKPAEPAAPAAAPAAKPAGPELIVNQIFVTAGRRSKGLVEILNNLKPGEEIVTAGQNKLSNGAPVEIDNSVTPKATDGASSK